MNHKNNKIFEEKVGMTFAQAYKKYYSSLKHYIMKSVYDEELSNDLTSDMLLSSLDNIDKFEPVYKYNSWLFTLTKNKLITLNTSKYSHINVSRPLSNYTDEINDSPYESNDNPLINNSLLKFKGLFDSNNLNLDYHDIYNNTVFIEKIWKFIDELPDESKLILYKRFKENMKLREIEQECNININTIKTILKRSSTILNQKLNNKNEYVY